MPFKRAARRVNPKTGKKIPYTKEEIAKAATTETRGQNSAVSYGASDIAKRRAKAARLRGFFEAVGDNKAKRG